MSVPHGSAQPNHYMPLTTRQVLPDFNCWSNTYVQLQFDFDPALEHIMDTEPKCAVAQASLKSPSALASN